MKTLAWIHVGDLHVTAPDEQNIRDLHEIVRQANRHFTDGVDFLFLPGDNANEGRADQYALIHAALDGLTLPLHVLPGDHDFEPRNLDAMRDGLGLPALPQAATIGGYRCLFLDIVSAGTGGPDFQLGKRQLDWLERELAAAQAGGVAALLFMHAYPRELTDCGERVAELVAAHDIACIAMGHTHYNELANDGTTIYSTVRSTGQVEEGPPGFAVTAVDDGVVSWRFKQLAAPYPFVLVTSPADERLITDPARQIKSGTLDVRARVWGETPLRRVTARIGDGPEQDLAQAGPSLWQGSIAAPDGKQTLVVRAEDETGASDADVVELFVGDRGNWTAPERAPAGSDENAIGAWTAKGIHGGQLGPNKNGRQW